MSAEPPASEPPATPIELISAAPGPVPVEKSWMTNFHVSPGSKIPFEFNDSLMRGRLFPLSSMRNARPAPRSSWPS